MESTPYSKDTPPRAETLERAAPRNVSGRSAEGHRIRKVATRYWREMHWCVVPAHVPVFGRDGSVGCSCKARGGCDKPGKHPIGTWAEIEYQTAPDRWREEWVPWEVNISLLTGRRSGGVVADVDPRHGGRLETLWERGWPRDTVTSRTGSGGWHVLAQCPPGGWRASMPTHPASSSRPTANR